MSTLGFILYELVLFVLVLLLQHKLSEIMYKNAVKKAIERFARNLANIR